jgi:dephospho-CoA kinase
MYLIGLTGGIASGKSIVSKRLSELGAVIVDADVLAREVVEVGTPGLAAIAKHFGQTVILPNGTLDRAALGAIIFADPAERAALNAITHPAVWARARELFADAETKNSNAIVVYDVPLLVEASRGRNFDFDLIVVVDASVETRTRRLMDVRRMSREEAAHRLNSQASDIERLAIADVVIDNNGTVDEAIRQVDHLWESIVAKRLSGAVPKLD